MIIILDQGINCVFTKLTSFKKSCKQTNLVVYTRAHTHTYTHTIPGMINKKLGDTGCLWKEKLVIDMKLTVYICIFWPHTCTAY